MRYKRPYLPPRQQRAQPHRHVPQSDAPHDVDDADPEAAVANRRVGLPLEAGEGRVAAQKPDHQQRTPVGAGVQRSVSSVISRPMRNEPVTLIARVPEGNRAPKRVIIGDADQVPRQRPDAAAQHDQQVLHRDQAGCRHSAISFSSIAPVLIIRQ